MVRSNFKPRRGYWKHQRLGTRKVHPASTHKSISSCYDPRGILIPERFYQLPAFNFDILAIPRKLIFMATDYTDLGGTEGILPPSSDAQAAISSTKCSPESLDSDPNVPTPPSEVISKDTDYAPASGDAQLQLADRAGVVVHDGARVTPPPSSDAQAAISSTSYSLEGLDSDPNVPSPPSEVISTDTYYTPASGDVRLQLAYRAGVIVHEGARVTRSPSCDVQRDLANSLPSRPLIAGPGILVLPNEIILLAATYMDFEDMRTIALVSQRLYWLLFPLYLELEGVLSSYRNVYIASNTSHVAVKSIRQAAWLSHIPTLRIHAGELDCVRLSAVGRICHDKRTVHIVDVFLSVQTDRDMMQQLNSNACVRLCKGISTQRTVRSSVLVAVYIMT